MPTLSTLGQNALVRSETAKLQLEINRLQQQVTSGKKTDRYGDLGSLASLDISLRNRGTQIETFKVNIQTVRARTDIIDATLGSIRENILEIRNLAVANKIFDTSRQDLITRAREAVSDVMQKLQANVDGRFLFSGIETGNSPVMDPAILVSSVQAAVSAVLPAPVPDVQTAVRTAVDTAIGTPATYYLGGVKHQPAEIEQNVTVDYSITADASAFRKALQGFLQIATLPMPKDDPVTAPDVSRSDWDATVNDAAGFLTDALSGVEILQLNNGRNGQILDDIGQTHEATLTIIQSQISDIEQVDLVDASTRLTQLRTQLAASFSVTADLRGLSLINFLR